ESALLKKVSERLAAKGMFIADGHHRYEIGLAYRDWMEKKYPEAGDQAPFHYIMMFCAEVSDPGLIILPTHRLVLRPNLDSTTLISRLRERFKVHSFSKERLGLFLQDFGAKADRRGFGVVLGQEVAPYHFIELPPSDLLDVQSVHQSVLREILGFTEEDEKNPERIAYVKDQQELLSLVEREPDDFGILLSAPSPAEVFRVAQKGTVLPPKSTYFFPKLLSGLVFNPIDPEEEVII
ncbi:MAG: DUF1015 family protein, partial [Deltaproteobacteria bacterium]|nr:DUF1015 family protein [Deltaproteobacteria bacterium]